MTKFNMAPEVNKPPVAPGAAPAKPDEVKSVPAPEARPEAPVKD